MWTGRAGLRSWIGRPYRPVNLDRKFSRDSSINKVYITQINDTLRRGLQYHVKESKVGSCPSRGIKQREEGSLCHARAS